MHQLEAEVSRLCLQLKRRQIEGSAATARATAELLRQLITRKFHPDAQSLLNDVTYTGITVQAAKPMELAIGNIVRRVLHMIREESYTDGKDLPSSAPCTACASPIVPLRDGLLSRAFQEQPRNMSLHNLLDWQPADSPRVADASSSGGSSGGGGRPRPPAGTDREGRGGAQAERLGGPPDRPGLPERAGLQGQPGEAGPGRPPPVRREKAATWQGKASVIEQLNELIGELRDIEGNIAIHATDHIHANEVILTLGHSNTVLGFLLEAAKKRSFQVVVAEGAPGYGGHRMARTLAAHGIATTAIPDAAIFALMARVNKVLVGAHALLANGGAMLGVGAGLAALAAQRHAVPFVVLAGLHKLSPLFPHDPGLTFNEFRSPAELVDYGVLEELAEAASAEDVTLQILNPALDYVPPEHIALFLTDTGGYNPSYTYRLLAEVYSREDFALSKELLDHTIR